MKFTEADYHSITRMVEEAERKTTAELVVVIRPRSGNYRDVDYLFGAVLAFASLLVILFSPWIIDPNTIPLEIVIIFALAAWICSKTPLRRWLTTRRRREREVKRAAAEAFVDEGVMNTRARTGMLVYLSALERQIEVMADTGIMTGVPPAELNALLFEIKQVPKAKSSAATLLDKIREAGEVLARHMPATHDNPDEIPNRPRVARMKG